jgi:endoglucanase
MNSSCSVRPSCATAVCRSGSVSSARSTTARHSRPREKERLGADSWGGTDEHIRDVVDPLESLLAREFPDFNPYPWGAQKWAARLLRHILISEALIPEFAERFRGITPNEARELAWSFRWESCTRRTGLEQTLRLELAKG